MKKIIFLALVFFGCGSPEYSVGDPTPHQCSFGTIEGKGYLILCDEGIYKCLDHDDRIIESGCYFEDFNKTHIFNCVEECGK